jgi:hypothetical protein
METIKIEATATLTETADTTLPDLEECPRLNDRKPLPLRRFQLPKDRTPHYEWSVIPSSRDGYD